MKFSIKTRCKACEGTGWKDSVVDSNHILSIVLRNSTGVQVQKLNAIKAVREQFAIGLKEAKELVEGAMAFLVPIQAHASAVPKEEFQAWIDPYTGITMLDEADEIIAAEEYGVEELKESKERARLRTENELPW